MDKINIWKDNKLDFLKIDKTDKAKYAWGIGNAKQW